MASTRASCGPWSSHCSSYSCGGWHLNLAGRLFGFSFKAEFNFGKVLQYWLLLLKSPFMKFKVRYSTVSANHWTGNETGVAIEAPNQLVMRREQLKRDHLDKYKVKNRSYHMYAAAARIWAQGVDWSVALAIVSDAFQAATVQEWRIVSYRKKHRAPNMFDTNSLLKTARDLMLKPSWLPTQNHVALLVFQFSMILWSKDMWFQVLFVGFWVGGDLPYDLKTGCDKGQV